MSSDKDQQTELRIQKGIRQSEEQIVLWIQKALDDRSSYGDLEESQFRNLVRVAETTESAEVIKNFLRYQVGRDKKWGRGKSSLAERIIQDIDVNLKEIAKDIAQEVQEVTQNTISTLNMKEIQIELIRRYLGYGARYLKYLNAG